MNVNIKGPSKLMAVVIYLLAYALIGALFVLLSIGIAGFANGAGFGHCIDLYVHSTYTKNAASLSVEELSAYYIGSGIGNALTYALMAFGVLFYMRDDFKNDFILIKEKPKFYSIYIPVSAIVFAGAAIGLSLLFGNFVDSSENQVLIENILKHAGAVPMIISTILLAPIVEEAIYRKCVFHYLNRYPVWVSYLVSTILFALPHMITTNKSFGTWCLIAIPYLLDGLMLAAVYHLSKKNIYASIAAHMLNNIIAVILVFV